MAEVEVTFELDSRGVLTVTAVDLETGKTRRLVVGGSRPSNDTNRPARGTKFVQLQTPFLEVVQLRTHVHETFMQLASALTRPEVRKIVGAIQHPDEIEDEKREGEVGTTLVLQLRRSAGRSRIGR